MARDEDCLQRGREVMRKLWGPRAGERAGVLYEVAPEFADMVTGVTFGEVWADETLPLRERSLATLSALIVLNRQPELRLHLRGALNLGISKAEIVALIKQMAFYGGLPVSVESLRTAKEVFERWDAQQAKG